MSLSPFQHAVSGAMGAVCALAATYPLDVIKTRQQASKPVGFLFDGIKIALVGSAATNFAYFYYYFALTKFIENRSLFASMAMSAFAAALCQITTLPLSVVITRQQTDAAPFFKIFQKILVEHGVTGFWAGLKPSLVLVLNPTITYGFYGPIKRAFFPHSPLKTMEVFFVSALAKTLATLVTYPLILYKTRQQCGSKESLNQMYKSKGIKGLYTGFRAQIFKAVLSQALLMVTKDKMDSYAKNLLK